MPILAFECFNCKRRVKLFSHKEHVCPKCGSDRIKRVLSVPLKNRNTEGTTSDYHGMESLSGIKDDVKQRNKKHQIETLNEVIDKHGVKNAKQQGWIKKDGTKKSDWDDK